MQQDALASGANVVVIDDLIATGGSAYAAHQLVEQAHAKVIQNLFVVDVSSPRGHHIASLFPGSEGLVPSADSGGTFLLVRRSSS